MSAGRYEHQRTPQGECATRSGGIARSGIDARSRPRQLERIPARLCGRQKSGQAGNGIFRVVKSVIHDLTLHCHPKQQIEIGIEIDFAYSVIQTDVARGGRCQHADRKTHDGLPVHSHPVELPAVAPREGATALDLSQPPQVFDDRRTHPGSVQQFQCGSTILWTRRFAIEDGIRAGPAIEHEGQNPQLGCRKRLCMTHAVQEVECHQTQHSQWRSRPSREEQRNPPRKGTHCGEKRSDPVVEDLPACPQGV